MERDGDEIPTPSFDLSSEITDGNVVMPVTIHPDLYRAKRDNERVKTNITLTCLSPTKKGAIIGSLKNA